MKHDAYRLRLFTQWVLGWHKAWAYGPCRTRAWPQTKGFGSWVVPLGWSSRLKWACGPLCRTGIICFCHEKLDLFVIILYGSILLAEMLSMKAISVMFCFMSCMQYEMYYSSCCKLSSAVCVGLGISQEYREKNSKPRTWLLA